MFLEFNQFFLFMTAVVILNLTPGADVLYIANQTLSKNKTYGIMAALGISTGILFHILATSFGLAEVMQYSPKLFFAIKTLGVVYLLYLAWGAFRAKEFGVKEFKRSNQSIMKTYYMGILTTVLNPKVLLFFLTFLPQFAVSEQEDLRYQLLCLGGLFLLSGTLVNVGYAFCFDKIKKYLLVKKWFSQLLNKLTAVLFTFFAFKLFLAESD
jgi:threonine/homoserine/homoserine lactone efflux protein